MQSSISDMNKDQERSDPEDQSNMASQRRRVHQQGPKKSTKEKIDRLMSDGAKNYPAYLKLIYTGDSELSSEDEFSIESTASRNSYPSSIPSNRSSSNEKFLATNASQLYKTNNAIVPDSLATNSINNGIQCSSDVRRDVTKSEVTGKKIGTPESDKLLDPGREKQGSPVDVKTCADRDAIHSNHQRLVDSTASSTASSSIQSSSAFCAHWSSEYPLPFKPSDNDADIYDKSQLRDELAKVQDDIATLKTVLAMKQKEAADLRLKLGHRPINDLKQSLQSFKDSDAFQKTNAVCKSFSAFASRKMENFRNLNVFKPIEYNKDASYSGIKHSQSTEEISSKQDPLPTSRSDTNVARRLTTSQRKERI